MINLNVPLATWIAVAAAVIIFVIITAISSRRRKALRHVKVRREHHHIVQIGSETDEFFIPGDPLPDRDSYDSDQKR